MPNCFSKGVGSPDEKSPCAEKKEKSFSRFGGANLAFDGSVRHFTPEQFALSWFLKPSFVVLFSLYICSALIYKRVLT